MAKYHIVVGINKATNQTEMLFGDYHKQVAIDEMDGIQQGYQDEFYKKVRVITLDNDNQAAIDAKIAELNGK